MNTVSILTWNIQGQANITGYTSLAKTSKHLQSLEVDIFALQECPNPKKFLSSSPLFTSYHLASSDLPKKDKNANYNYNIVLSKHPILKKEEFAFTTLEKKEKIENALKVELDLNGVILRLYNCHFPIFKVGPSLRLKLLQSVFEDSKSHGGPVIVCGDLNTCVPKPGIGRSIVSTWHGIPKKEYKHLTSPEHEHIYHLADEHGFAETSQTPHPTWSMFKTAYFEPWKLKLDWLMAKNLKVLGSSLGTYVSDHRPLTGKFSL